VLECLCEHFPAIGREQWLDRIARGRVLDINGNPIHLDLAYREGLCIYYFREVPNEKVIPVRKPSCTPMSIWWSPTSLTSCP
jgi:tRNA pseudouridine32 synthase/23S rRNA pseudouridine746 synthase